MSNPTLAEAEGARAFLAGTKSSDNPYRMGPRRDRQLRGAWLRGWLNASRIAPVEDPLADDSDVRLIRGRCPSFVDDGDGPSRRGTQ